MRQAATARLGSAPATYPIQCWDRAGRAVERRLPSRKRQAGPDGSDGRREEPRRRHTRSRLVREGCCTSQACNFNAANLQPSLTASAREAVRSHAPGRTMALGGEAEAHLRRPHAITCCPPRPLTLGPTKQMIGPSRVEAPASRCRCEGVAVAILGDCAHVRQAPVVASDHCFVGDSAVE